MEINEMNDAYGAGLLAYHKGKRTVKFRVWSNIAETEQWPVSLFFRPYKEMPEIEQVALKGASGRILDVGAGAGSHSLWLEEQGKEVVSIDISPGAVEVMKQRGVKQAVLADYFDYIPGEGFDTLLLLMNGIGIVETLEGLPRFFETAKRLLKKGGKIIVDSSDVKYLYEDEDGSYMVDLNAAYYGELEYRIDFMKQKGEPFGWLFVDFDLLSEYAREAGFDGKKVFEDEHYLYLAEFTLL